ncbi:MAG: hypothetical protein J6D10_04645, partial [Clostridia bacterium]|nr:hypothetical protein [Clostridia bacterium]
MRRRFFTVPGSRTMFSLIVLLALAVVSLGITVFADEAPAEAVVVEGEALEVIEETAEEAPAEEEADTPAAFATALSLLPP